ncbi:hypothetical protein VKT23_018725 [Stygiomarasmius scandens]|uniref:REJ domain-containing protein n=1 Tax=Marasmiellus scandens TaxID=2682957 RepID=A0ABR1ISL8_9AGAR
MSSSSSATMSSKPPPKPMASSSSSPSSSESAATLYSVSSPSSLSTAVPKIKSSLKPSSSPSITFPPLGSPSGTVSRTRGRGHSISTIPSSRESSLFSRVNSPNPNLPTSTSAGALLSPSLSPAISQTLAVRLGDDRLSASSSFRLEIEVKDAWVEFGRCKDARANDAYELVYIVEVG